MAAGVKSTPNVFHVKNAPFQKLVTTWKLNSSLDQWTPRSVVLKESSNQVLTKLRKQFPVLKAANGTPIFQPAQWHL